MNEKKMYTRSLEQIFERFTFCLKANNFNKEISKIFKTPKVTSI